MKNNIPIIITAAPGYLADQSNPVEKKFIWSYEISITNNSAEIVQLLNRFWRITDMSGKIEQIQGVGVVGLQPLIKPEKCFIYTSFCQLHTPQGTMEGHFEMQNLAEERFHVVIPKFILTAPVAAEFRDKLH